MKDFKKNGQEELKSYSRRLRVSEEEAEGFTKSGDGNLGNRGH